MGGVSVCEGVWVWVYVCVHTEAGRSTAEHKPRVAEAHKRIALVRAQLFTVIISITTRAVRCNTDRGVKGKGLYINPSTVAPLQTFTTYHCI